MTLRTTLHSSSAPPAAAPAASLHRVDLPSLAELPPHWYCGSPTGTAAVQACLAALPAAERMLTRSVNRHIHELGDRVLRLRVRAFREQKAHHADERERLGQLFAAQGYRLAPIVGATERVASGVEAALPALLLLSMAAGFEHIKTVLAERGLRGEFLGRCPEKIRLLLQWHGAEEIALKCVAFDVLQHFSRGYLLRVAGFLLGALLLLAVLFGGALCWWQGPARPRGWAGRDLSLLVAQVRSVEAGKLLAYLRPGFHPAQDDSFGLARRWTEAHAGA